MKVLVHRNIFANIVGTAIITLLTIATTPVLIRLLGMEAYGIIGFVVTLQVAFTAFDFGLSSTLVRELGADQSPDKAASAPLIRTAMTIYWIMALVLGLGLFAGVHSIATRWFNPGELSPVDLERSLQIIALYLALRWPVALYTGILSGLQRLDIQNTTKVAANVLRLGGGVLVVLQWRTLQSYLWWTAATAVLEVAAYYWVCRRVYSGMPVRPGISAAVISRVWRFSLSMNVLGFLAVIIVQLDRLTVSKLLSLQDLGVYNLVYTAASLIIQLIAAVSTAVLPWFAAAQGTASTPELARRYHDANRLMLVLAGLPGFALIGYGEPLLRLWVGASAAGTGVPMALLAVGFLISAAITNVYNVAVAMGAPQRFMKANLAAIVPYAALLYVLTRAFGLEGAAACWIILNLFYALVLVHRVHQNIGVSTARWASRTILPFVVVGTASYPLVRLIFEQAMPKPGVVIYAAALTVSTLLYLVLFVLVGGGMENFRLLLRRLASRRTG